MKIGLVLAGGGGKGAYQIGVWKAFKELGVDRYIKGISGTSVGALNAVLFSQGSYEQAEAIWMDITRDKILPLDNIELFAKGIKLFLGNKNINLIKRFNPKVLEQGSVSRQGLQDIIDQKVDFTKIKNSPLSLYAACTELPEVKIKYFRLNNLEEASIKRILFASSALPTLYECEKINCRKYIDGGITDNVPIQPLYGEGCDVIFVVMLSRESMVDKSQFPNARIIELVPSSEPGGVLSGVLDFSPEGIRKRIVIGYEDTMNLIAPLLELGRLQKKKAAGETIVNLTNSIVKKSKDIGVNITERYKRAKTSNIQ